MYIYNQYVVAMLERFAAIDRITSDMVSELIKKKGVSEEKSPGKKKKRTYTM